MSLSDTAKALQRHAQSLLSGNRIVFHHVPKCGGTSVGRALRLSYFLSQGTVTPIESDKAFQVVQESKSPRPVGQVSDLREMMLLYMLYSDVRCVAAHIPFSDAAFDRFSGSYSFVTLLRHPVERFISNYFWSHKHPDGVQHVSESLEEFIGTDRARRLGSTYARYFSGEPAADEFTTKHAVAAVRNLKRMHLVGFLDDLGRFQGGLRSLTTRRIKIGKENVGHNSSERDRILSGPLKERILDACAIDLAIWEQIEDLRPPERFAQLEKEPGRS